MPVQIKRTEEAAASVREEARPNNSTYFDKPQYSNKVSDQVMMTAMSYQDYYARLHGDMEKAGMSDEDKVEFAAFHQVMVTMHKGGDRALKALREDGKNWRNSDYLSNADKEYLGYAEKNLEKLKGMGISLEAPEAEVLSKISGTFGVAGQEAVRNAKLMPIYGEVITDKEHLQKGDRVLAKDYAEGNVLGLRGGNVAATAILYMTTFMTCQGVSVKWGPSAESFVKTTAGKGNDAYAGSSDEKALKKIGYTDDRVEKLKKQGMFAIGLAMFTKGRFDDLSAYYVMQDQLDCCVSLAANPGSFVQGQAPADLQIMGILSITKGESETDRGGNKPMCVELFMKGMEAGGKAVYKKVYETAPITAHDGEFVVSIQKAELDKFKAGEYLVTANYEGEVLGEDIACGAETGITIEKPKVKEPKKRLLPPLRATMSLFTRRRAEERFEDADGTKEYRKNRLDQFEIRLEDVDRKGFLIGCKFYFDEVWESKGGRFEHRGSKDGMPTGMGLEVGYQHQINLTKGLKTELEGVVGFASTDFSEEFIGSASGKLVLKDFLAFGMKLTKEFEGSLERFTNKPSQPSIGFTGRVDIGNWTAEVAVSDVNSKKPLAQFTIGRAFRP